MLSYLVGLFSYEYEHTNALKPHVFINICVVIGFADTTSPPFDMAEVAKVPHWVDMICDRCILGLVKLQKPFKYIVSAAIVQNVSITAQL